MNSQAHFGEFAENSLGHGSPMRAGEVCAVGITICNLPFTLLAFRPQWPDRPSSFFLDEKRTKKNQG